MRAHGLQVDVRVGLKGAQHLPDFLARIEHDGLAFAQRVKALEQQRKNPCDGLLAAAGQQQDRAGHVVAHGRFVAGIDERMAHEIDRQLGVGIAIDLKREDRGEGIEIARHGETAPGFPRPDLRGDVIKGADVAAAGPGDAALAQRRGDAQVEARIIDEADGARPVRLDPAHGLAHEGAEVGEVAQHLDKADDRGAREVVEHLHAGGGERGAAERGESQAGLELARGQCERGGMLVARVFAGDEQHVDRARLGRRERGARVGADELAHGMRRRWPGRRAFSPRRMSRLAS